MKYTRSIMFAGTTLFLLTVLQQAASASSFLDAVKLIADTTIKDSVIYETTKGLPLKPARRINITTNEGTWTSLDMSPDGKTIVFDMMGDIYTIPASGGTATAVTKGIAFDCHPRYSPDGKRLLFVSDRSGAENLWLIDFEKKDTVQLTKEKNQLFPAGYWYCIRHHCSCKCF